MAVPQPSWPPPGLPLGALVFQLGTNDKRPPHGFMGAHHRAAPVEQALLVPGPAASYGIKLDEMFLLADRDLETEQALAAEAALPATWTQKTRRGTHHLYRVPSGLVASNVPWLDADGKQIGELKVHGYLVGPGSTVAGHIYTLLDARDPAPAPQALLDAVSAKPSPLDTPVRERIVCTERDTMMTKLAGSMRRQNYSEGAIGSMLWAIARSDVMEQPLEDPWTAKDAARVARSAMRWEGGTDIGNLIGARFGPPASEDPLIGADLEWLMDDFIPRGELITLYGDGGCGKSTLGSWLAAQVTRAGGLFVHAGIEETFRLFARRAALMGADCTKLVPLINASRYTFPAVADALEDELVLSGAVCLWLDAIYAHFDANDRRSSNERARSVMGRLSEMAQAANCTIVAGTHENKAGDYMGSTEMKNVSRCLLHAQRKDEAGEPLVLTVKKANFTKPQYAATFIGQVVPAMNPEDGRIQYERRDGKRVPQKDTICSLGEPRPLSKGKGKTERIKGTVNLGDIDVQITHDKE